MNQTEATFLLANQLKSAGIGTSVNVVRAVDADTHSVLLLGFDELALSVTVEILAQP